MNKFRFKNKKANINKLIEFGFIKKDEEYTFKTFLLDGQFEMIILLDKDDYVITKLVDTGTREEYVLHLIKTATGEFVGKVKEEYEKTLNEISNACFDSDVYKLNQTNEVINYIIKKYKNYPEFPWNDENSIVRRSDNEKWYAVFLKVSAKKIGLDSDEIIEIMNIKMKPSDVERLVDQKGYFPAYHMNKKHWVTILLGDYIETNEILKRVDESYKLSGGRKG